MKLPGLNSRLSWWLPFDMKDKSNPWMFFRLLLLGILYGGGTPKNQDLRKESTRHLTAKDFLSFKLTVEATLD
jgi:hypothetical protein